MVVPCRKCWEGKVTVVIAVSRRLSRLLTPVIPSSIYKIIFAKFLSHPFSPLPQPPCSFSLDKTHFTNKKLVLAVACVRLIWNWMCISPASSACSRAFWASSRFSFLLASLKTKANHSHWYRTITGTFLNRHVAHKNVSIRTNENEQFAIPNSNHRVQCTSVLITQLRLYSL